MNHRCPECGGRHATLSDRIRCLADGVSYRNRDRFRHAYGRKDDDND